MTLSGNNSIDVFQKKEKGELVKSGGGKAASCYTTAYAIVIWTSDHCMNTVCQSGFWLFILPIMTDSPDTVLESNVHYNVGTVLTYGLLKWTLLGLSVYGYLCTRVRYIIHGVGGTRIRDTVRIQLKLSLSLWHESGPLNFPIVNLRMRRISIVGNTSFSWFFGVISTDLFQQICCIIMNLMTSRRASCLVGIKMYSFFFCLHCTRVSR